MRARPTLHRLAIVANGQAIVLPPLSLREAAALVRGLRAAGATLEVVGVTPLYKRA